MIIFFLLFFKHWYIDFVNQTNDEVAGKGIYGNIKGIQHSLKHGIATFVIFSFFTGLPVAIFVGFVDFVLHYHIDYVKMNYGNRDITTKQFWAHLGLDQFAHYLTYLYLVNIFL